MSGPMKNFEADLTAKMVNYDNNPILKWNLSNAIIRVDRNNNYMLDKAKARKRIDGVASLMDAYVCYERNLDEYLNII